MTTTCHGPSVVASDRGPIVRHPARAPVDAATEAELRAPMPGDHLVPGCQYVMTRAVSVDAPPDAVWPWLVAAGVGRAGFYANDLLGDAGCPDADGAEHLVWATPDSTWAWTLARSGAGTRLVTRLRMLYRCNRSSEAVFSRMLDDCEDLPVLVKTLLAVKQRAEAAHSPNG